MPNQYSTSSRNRHQSRTIDPPTLGRKVIDALHDGLRAVDNAIAQVDQLIDVTALRADSAAKTADEHMLRSALSYAETVLLSIESSQRKLRDRIAALGRQLAVVQTPAMPPCPAKVGPPLPDSGSSGLGPRKLEELLRRIRGAIEQGRLIDKDHSRF